MSLLQEAIGILAEEGELPSKYRAHILSGRLDGIWECHLDSNWLLLWIKGYDMSLLQEAIGILAFAMDKRR